MKQMSGVALSWDNHEHDIPLQNVQARLRGSLIWMVANIHRALLISTSNKSEAAEFEFQGSLAMKDPKPMRPRQSKAKAKVGRSKQKRVKISPVDVSQKDPRSFKKATAKRRAARKPTRLRLFKKTKVASPKPKASIAAKRIWMFCLRQTYML